MNLSGKRRQDSPCEHLPGGSMLARAKGRREQNVACSFARQVVRLDCRLFSRSVGGRRALVSLSEKESRTAPSSCQSLRARSRLPSSSGRVN